MSNQVPPHFLVFVPGYMGSKLRSKRTGRAVWGDFSSIPAMPTRWRAWLDNLVETLKYPNDDLEPAGILDEVLFVPPWAKQEHYKRLYAALRGMGYQVDQSLPEAQRDVYEFPYDWRQDNRISARQLGAAVERWRALHDGAPAWIITHSNGGLVARWYIDKEGGNQHVGRLFLIASPWDGTPKAMALLLSGLDFMLRRRFNIFNVSARTREMFRTFPSAYQLIPHQDPFLRGLDNQTISPYDNLNWLGGDVEREFLEDARRFNAELGPGASVETICFFGRKQPTTTFGLVQFLAAGRWGEVRWHATQAGDGTLAERSAVHPNADEVMPVAAGHGDIYVARELLEKLQWELADKFTPFLERAVLVTDQFIILFEPDKDLYNPGESIRLHASVSETTPEGAPVSGAAIDVQAVWHAHLPGEEEPLLPPGPTVSTRLEEREDKIGSYEGELPAPEREGYYHLRATAEIVGAPALLLQELIAVEAAAEVPVE